MKLCPKCKKKYIPGLQLFCKKCNYQVGEKYITIEDKGGGKAPTITNEQEKEMMGQKESFKDGYDTASEEQDKKYGQKESDNKLSYELDWNFIEAMAKRMSQNKGKYAPYNRQKPMDIENLKQALLRHTIEVMKGNYTDTEDNDHLQAISVNAMFIYYQLKKCTQS